MKNKADKGVAVAIKVGTGKILAAFAFDDDLAAVRLVQPTRDVEERGFTGTAFTQKKHHSCFRENDRNVIQCLDAYAAFFPGINFC